MDQLKVFAYKQVRLFVTLFYKIIPQKLGLPVPPRPTASVIIPKNGKILVVKISYKKGYSLPGGGLVKLETFKEAATRELLEETGLMATDLKYFRTSADNDEYPSVNVVFIGKAKGRLKKSVEGQPLWVDPKEIVDQIVFSDARKAVHYWLKLHG